MRLLLDNNLSPALASALADAGHDVIHVRDIGLGACSDQTVLSRAWSEGRSLISADTDFGTLLSRSGDHGPSVILLRREAGRRPSAQLRLLLDNLPQLEGALQAGSLVVITDRLIRVRTLPLIPR